MERSDGVFVSRIALESAVYTSGCILVGDEILAVNLVDVTRMSLDDVVIIMSIPRRLVLTTRRKKSAPNRFGQNRNVEHKPTPVVVFKGDPDQHHQSEFAFRSDIRQLGGSGPQDGPFLSPSRHRDNSQFRDSRTLTWDRNPKPDRNDPKYFPINSLPRQRVSNTGAASSSSRESGWTQYEGGRERERDLMPPPMSALPSYQPPPPVVTEQPRLSKEPTHFKPYKHPYSPAGQPSAGKSQGLGEKLNQANFHQPDFYSENSESYNNDSGNILGHNSQLTSISLQLLSTTVDPIEVYICVEVCQSSPDLVSQPASLSKMQQINNLI